LKQEKFYTQGPRFVINDKDVETRTVQIAGDKLAELVFQYLDDRRGKVATIVPGFGPDARYEGAIAWQKGSAPKEALKNSPSAGAGASNSSTMASEDYNEWEDHITPVRPLQQRSRS
jgi:hypothetical protein